MKKYTIIIAASVIALILTGIIAVRISMEKSHFDRTVREALMTSEGYDQAFIDMVNRLERELAARAQFGYTGNKDPMTGTRRMVVQPASPVQRNAARPKPAVAGEPEPAPVPAPVVQNAVDPVRLTAIIADASGKKITAVIMDGERSYSVETGEKVANRKITKITNDGIYMETDSMMYFYDISGNRAEKKK